MSDSSERLRATQPESATASSGAASAQPEPVGGRLERHAAIGKMRTYGSYRKWVNDVQTQWKPGN